VRRKIPKLRVSLSAVCLALPLLAQAGEKPADPEPDALPPPGGYQLILDREELMDLSLEELLTIPVQGASRYAQDTREAPSAVTVVTAAEIRRYGWRTVGEILDSIRGVSMTRDRLYGYAGVRGFPVVGDYNTRVPVLIDGAPVYDGIYNQAFFEEAALLDVDWIERLEWIPGPGSSLYGGNALFGIVNIITRDGASLPGTRAGLRAGERGSRGGLASFGHRDKGQDLFLAASAQRLHGEPPYIREFDTPEQNNGRAEFDTDENQRVFAKYRSGGWLIEGAFADRQRQPPTAPFDSLFNDPRARIRDRTAMASAGYESAIADEWTLLGRLSYGSYDYTADLPFAADPGSVMNRDAGYSNWWVAEWRALDTRIAGHKFVYGIEYRDDFRADQRNRLLGTDTVLLDERHDFRRYGVYAQDEFRIRDDLIFNGGLRYDNHSEADDALSPRAALIYLPSPGHTTKLIGGTAYRTPNPYERFYSIAADGDAVGVENALPDEEIRSLELNHEWRVTPRTRFLGGLFQNDVRHHVRQTTDPLTGASSARSFSGIRAHGAEFEFEHQFGNDARLHASYTWQDAEDKDSGDTPMNSPKHLLKLRASQPLPWRDSELAFELNYVSERLDRTGDSVPSYAVANLIYTVRPVRGLDLRLGVYNLFDEDYADPVNGSDYTQLVIPRDGRGVLATLIYTFR
jgi:iron complex outermembrane receptor protein